MVFQPISFTVFKVSLTTKDIIGSIYVYICKFCIYYNIYKTFQKLDHLQKINKGQYSSVAYLVISYLILTFGSFVFYWVIFFILILNSCRVILMICLILSSITMWWSWLLLFLSCQLIRRFITKNETSTERNHLWKHCKTFYNKIWISCRCVYTIFLWIPSHWI